MSTPQRRDTDQYVGTQIAIGVFAIAVAAAIVLITLWKGGGFTWITAGIVGMFIFFAGLMMPTDRFLRGLSIARLWRRGNGNGDSSSS